ncbi:hypothetical protein AI19_06110 [Thalassolituus oleivorans 4BN06-13]|nr:hypothetical protein [Thalassolituus oleivorans 4BN06-13]
MSIINAHFEFAYFLFSLLLIPCFIFLVNLSSLSKFSDENNEWHSMYIDFPFIFISKSAFPFLVSETEKSMPSFDSLQAIVNSKIKL